MFTGHHGRGISHKHSNLTVLDCLSPSVEEYSLLTSVLLTLAAELAFSVHSFICFMFSLRQIFSVSGKV